MSNAYILLVGFAVIGACRPELDSIKPEQRTETYLVVPARDHRFVVAAEIMVPTGYVHDMGTAGFNTFIRGARDPDIRITSGLSIHDPIADEPDPKQFSRCMPELDAGDRVAQRMLRTNGDVIVCELSSSYPARVNVTFVARNYRWHEYDFQCEVSFRRLIHPDGPYDEGNPSASRLRDAIAICDSFEVREMRQTELERFFPVPAEILREVPESERYLLYPQMR